jgi:TolA-binding protein
LDASVLDAGVLDAGVLDAGVLDAGVLDAGVLDASVLDASVLDAGVLDAGVLDAGVLDAGVFIPVPFVPPVSPFVSSAKIEARSINREADGETEVEPEQQNPLANAQETATQAQEVALTAANDIAPLLEAAPGGAGVAAALIAVAGGGAAFKFYSQWNKNKHEESMERMRLESEKSESDHAKCGIERATLVAQIEQLNGKIKELEDKNKALSLSMGDDLTERLEKIEKQLSKVKKVTKTIPATKI